MDSVGEGEGGMIWENGNETCIISLISIQNIHSYALLNFILMPIPAVLTNQHPSNMYMLPNCPNLVTERIASIRIIIDRLIVLYPGNSTFFSFFFLKMCHGFIYFLFIIYFFKFYFIF